MVLDTAPDTELLCRLCSMVACYPTLCGRLSALLRCRPAEVPPGLRAATAPLPQVSSAQEDPELMDPAQGMAGHCGVSPFCAFAQSPDITPPRMAFQASSLFQSAARVPAAAPREGGDTRAAPASHTVHQDRLLPPRGPFNAGQTAAALQIEPSVSAHRLLQSMQLGLQDTITISGHLFAVCLCCACSLLCLNADDCLVGIVRTALPSHTSPCPESS